MYDNTNYFCVLFQNTILYQNLYLKGSTLYLVHVESTKLPSSLPYHDGLKSLKSNLTIYTEIQAFTNMDAVNR